MQKNQPTQTIQRSYSAEIGLVTDQGETIHGETVHGKSSCDIAFGIDVQIGEILFRVGSQICKKLVAEDRKRQSDFKRESSWVSPEIIANFASQAVRDLLAAVLFWCHGVARPSLGCLFFRSSDYKYRQRQGMDIRRIFRVSDLSR